MYRWPERLLSGHFDIGNDADSDLCTVSEEYRVHFWKWPFSFFDGDIDGALVSVSEKVGQGSLKYRFFLISA